MVKISEREIELFEQRAPGALSRRGNKLFLHELSHGFNILLLGFVPIIGMSCFGWSSKYWLLFLWINLWAGILFDTIRYLFLKNQIKNYIKTCFEDDFVWLIADALKAGKKEVPQQHLKGDIFTSHGTCV